MATTTLAALSRLGLSQKKGGYETENRNRCSGPHGRQAAFVTNIYIQSVRYPGGLPFILLDCGFGLHAIQEYCLLLRWIFSFAAEMILRRFIWEELKNGIWKDRYYAGIYFKLADEKATLWPQRNLSFPSPGMAYNVARMVRFYQDISRARLLLTNHIRAAVLPRAEVSHKIQVERGHSSGNISSLPDVSFHHQTVGMLGSNLDRMHIMHRQNHWSYRMPTHPFALAACRHPEAVPYVLKCVSVFNLSCMQGLGRRQLLELQSLKNNTIYVIFSSFL